MKRGDTLRIGTAIALVLVFAWFLSDPMSCIRAAETVGNRPFRAIAEVLHLCDAPHHSKPNGGLHPRVECVDAVVHGTYTPTHTTTPRDTLPVVVVVQVDGHDTTATITIGADTVRVDSARVCARVERLRWSVAAGATWHDAGIIPSAGGAWSPLAIGGLDIGLCASTRIPTCDRLIAGVRIARRVHSTLVVVADIGYAVVGRRGFAVGVSAGFAL